MTNPRRQQRRATNQAQLGLVEQRPSDHATWHAMPTKTRTKVARLLARMLREHVERQGEKRDE